MHSPYIFEISVESVEAGVAAERAGAHRIELCSNIRGGGTTPSPELMRAMRDLVGIPIFVMNRPRAGNFVNTDLEFGAMQRDVETAKQFGMDGVVLGLLNDDGVIDVERSQRLVEHAWPLPVTYHRAFDECMDLPGSLERVIETGATRLLTSGGKRTALKGLEMLGVLVKLAGDRLTVMPGRGIHSGNIREVVQKTGAVEYHAGLSSVIASSADNIGNFEVEVRKLAVALAACD